MIHLVEHQFVRQFRSWWNEDLWQGGHGVGRERHIALVALWTCLMLLLGLFWWSRRSSGDRGNETVGGGAVRQHDAIWSSGGARGFCQYGGGSASASTADGANRASGCPRNRPKVSISLDNILFESDPITAHSSPEDAASTPATERRLVGELIPESLPPFLALCQIANVYPICQVDSDEAEEECRRLLESIGAFQSGLQRHRVLFSSTVIGRVSMVRQLQPTSHIESDRSVIQALQGKVHNLVFVQVLYADPQGLAEEGKSVAAASGNGAADSKPDFVKLADCVEVLRAIRTLNDG